MTNADKIRSMTDEELANLLAEEPIFIRVFFPKYCEIVMDDENPGFCDDDCHECILNWLKREVTE